MVTKVATGLDGTWQLNIAVPSSVPKFTQSLMQLQKQGMIKVA